MKAERIIKQRDPSVVATCTREIGASIDAEGVYRIFYCGALMQLVIKESKCWSYQERVSERCTAGHIAHAQAVVVESEIEEGC